MSARLSSMQIKNQDLNVLKRITKVPADLNVQLANSNSYTSSLPWAKHGSWLNVAEIELSVLQSKCLERRITDIGMMHNEEAAWEAERKNSWRFTTAQSRIKLMWSAKVAGENKNQKSPVPCFQSTGHNPGNDLLSHNL